MNSNYFTKINNSRIKFNHIYSIDNIFINNTLISKNTINLGIKNNIIKLCDFKYDLEYLHTPNLTCLLYSNYINEIYN